MSEAEYYLAWPEAIDLHVKVSWSQPYTHDLLLSRMAPEDETAYLYSIISKFGNEWLPLYIGMVYNQCVSERHSAPDHKARMEKLQKRFPESIFYITLGTPQFISGRLSQNTIKEIEQLLIYCNWNDKMINAKEINAFDSSKQIRIINEGFIEHICQESVYGVFYR